MRVAELTPERVRRWHYELGERLAADAAAHHAATTVGQVAAFHDAILACAVLSIIGLIGVVLMRDSDAAASMGKKPEASADAH